MTAGSTRGLYIYGIPYVIISSLQYSFIKDGLRYADPLTFVAARYLIAAFATFLFARSFRLILNRDTFVLSLFTIMSTVMWFYGLQRVSPAQSAVLTSATPLFAIPVTRILLRERASRLSWAGTIVGFGGVTIYGLTLAGTGATLLGGILSAGSAIFTALQAVYYRKTRNQDQAATVGTMLFLAGVLCALLTPITFSLSVTPVFLLDLGYASIIGGFLNFFLWVTMLRRESVARVVPVMFAVPATTTLIETVETGIVPGAVTLSGIAIMFLGIYLARHREIVQTGNPRSVEDRKGWMRRLGSTSRRTSRQAAV